MRQLNECFLTWHMVDKWLAHFSNVLSEYDAKENKSKLILLCKVQLPAMAEPEELPLWLDLQGLCAKLKWLVQRRADRAWQQFQKPPEQTFTLFLAFICKEAKRAGITLGDQFLVHQLLVQVHTHWE